LRALKGQSDTATSTARSSGTAPPEVAARQLLSRPKGRDVLVPLVELRPADRRAGERRAGERRAGQPAEGLRVRAARRTEALAVTRRAKPQQAALAAEQPFRLLGYHLNFDRLPDSGEYARALYDGLEEPVAVGHTARLVQIQVLWDELAASTARTFLAAARREARLAQPEPAKPGQAAQAAQLEPAEPSGEHGELALYLHSQLAPTPGKEGAAGTASTAAAPRFPGMLGFLADLDRWGALRAMGRLQAAGRESAATAAYLRQVLLLRSEIAAESRRETAVAAARAKAQQLLRVAGEKIGEARARELERRPGAADEPRLVLAQLGKSERRLVEREYETRRRTWELKVRNDCPHVRLAARLRAATTAQEARRLRQALSRYYERAPEDHRGWVLCKNCGFPALCSHVDLLIRSQIENVPFAEMRRRLAPWRAPPVKQDRGGGEATWAIYCKTCGERLAATLEEDRTAALLGRVGGLDDDLRKALWVEGLRLAPLLRFGAPVDPRVFAGRVADACHAPLVALGAQPAETLDPHSRLLTVVCVYAYALALIRRTQGRSGAREATVGLEGVKAGSKLSAYVRELLTALARRHSLAISRLRDVSPEYIKGRFREAYRLIEEDQGVRGPPVRAEEKAFMREVVDLDPALHYARLAARIGGAVPHRIETPAQARAALETVAGRSLRQLVAARPPPALAPFVEAYNAKAAVEIPRGYPLLHAHRAPEINLFRKMYDPPAKKSAEQRFYDLAPAGKEPQELLRFYGAAEAKPAKGRKYKAKDAETAKDRKNKPKEAKDAKNKAKGAKNKTGKDGKDAKNKTKDTKDTKGAKTDKGDKKKANGRLNVYDPHRAPYEAGLFWASYRLFREYTVERTSASAEEAILGRYAQARAAERAFDRARLVGRVLSYDFGLAGAGRRDTRRRLTLPPLTAAYDEQGRPHRWKIYVYRPRKEGGEPIELLREKGRGALVDAEGGARDPPFDTHYFAEHRCAVCKVLESETAQLDADAAASALRLVAEQLSFFTYYLSRCPEGGVHEYVEGACEKCGLSLDPEWRDSQAARDYFRRYREAYAAARERWAAGSRARITRKTELTAAPEKAFAEEFARGWTYDFALLSGAANAAGVPLAPLEAIGATEGQEYSEIAAGKGQADPAAAGAQLLAVRSAVQLFLADYSALRHYGQQPTPPRQAQELLREAEVPADSRGQLEEHLPDLAALEALQPSYSRQSQALQRLRGDQAAREHGLETLGRLARALQSLQKKAPSWLPVLGEKFAAAELRKIVALESSFAAPGAFDFAIFGVDEIAQGANADDFEAYGGPGSAGLEDLNEELADAEDPFKLEAVDMAEEDMVNLEG
jgi:hypothetical protein